METKDLSCKLLQKFDLLENELKCYITQCNKWSIYFELRIYFLLPENLFFGGVHHLQNKFKD